MQVELDCCNSSITDLFTGCFRLVIRNDILEDFLDPIFKVFDLFKVAHNQRKHLHLLKFRAQS